MAVLLDSELVTRIFKGVDLANNLAEGLITLAIGILTITITFIKDIFKGDIKKYKRTIAASWILLFLSIMAGIWSMMALSGSLINVDKLPRIDEHMFDSARVPAGFQVLLFLAGVFLVIRYGVIGVNNSKGDALPKDIDPLPPTVTAPDFPPGL